MFENIFSRRKNREIETEKPKITADNHEKNSLVISELSSLNIDVEMQHLPVADFLVNGVAIERKTISDFLSSMINKRLARQLEEIKQYPKSLLIIEGIDEQELYNDCNHEGINANAIRGFLLSILLGFQVPIIFTKDYADTARFISVLAKKEKREHTSLRARKKTMNKKEQLQYILEGFPGIGPATAKKLLKKFGCIRNIINASEEELKKGIGKKAELFCKIISDRYC
ncbi:hypothetical protein HYT26_00160 [Candidatus Pacearchaeota archaeon]|nr:hypothetical protein [Candidatus Pacearchaeota archaeon]